MKKIISLVLLTIAPIFALASGAGVHLDHADVDVSDNESLQKGAKMFVNYCQGCHSLDYMRYNRMAEDMDISKEDTEANLIFTTDEDGAPTKFGSLMFNNMDKKYGKQKFGTNPPNLSLIARSRGADWVYTYLNSFYLDDSRPLGVNNTVFKDVGMPHVLWELQGWQKAVYKTETNEAGTEIQVLDHLELASEGSLSPEEYKAATRDLTAFLVYVAEPAQLQRKMMGIWVLLFLFFFTFVAYLLKKEYWKDVH
jgi:ubiquinol-cytochrome c reductase cytochrome c1 subunit